MPFISARQSAWVAMLSTGDPAQQHQGLLVEVTYLPYGQMLFSMPITIKIKVTYNPVTLLPKRCRITLPIYWACVLVLWRNKE